jgi:hypothetical protein
MPVLLDLAEACMELTRYARVGDVVRYDGAEWVVEDAAEYGLGGVGPQNFWPSMWQVSLRQLDSGLYSPGARTETLRQGRRFDGSYLELEVVGRMARVFVWPDSHPRPDVLAFQVDMRG